MLLVAITIAVKSKIMKYEINSNIPVHSDLKFILIDNNKRKRNFWYINSHMHSRISVELLPLMPIIYMWLITHIIAYLIVHSSLVRITVWDRLVEKEIHSSGMMDKLAWDWQPIAWFALPALAMVQPIHKVNRKDSMVFSNMFICSNSFVLVCCTQIWGIT